MQHERLLFAKSCDFSWIPVDVFKNSIIGPFCSVQCCLLWQWSQEEIRVELLVRLMFRMESSSDASSISSG